MQDDEELLHLYKFRSTASNDWPYVERIFTHNELYFAKPSQFNDPFDCYPGVSLEATDAEFASYLDNLYKRRMPHLSRLDRRVSVKTVMKDRARNHRSQAAMDTLHDAMREAVERAGVLSLAASAEPVLMWSHYANAHKGVCFRFRATRDFPFFARAQPVEYKSQRPVINLIRDSPQAQVDKAVLTKADFWSYENEWRIVEHDLGPGVHRFPPETLDGIVFGAKCEPAWIQKVKVLVSGRNIELLQAHFSKHEFRIHIERLEA